jgi:tripartite-type tricarboxylate transporter receptor subunit TctC
VLSATLDKTLVRPEVQEKLLQLGIEPQSMSREQLKAFAKSEQEKWGRLIKAAGLKPAN